MLDDFASEICARMIFKAQFPTRLELRLLISKTSFKTLLEQSITDKNSDL